MSKRAPLSRQSPRGTLARGLMWKPLGPRIGSLSKRTDLMAISVFEEVVDLGVACRSFRHNDRFQEVIGIKELRHTFYNRICAKEMKAFVGALNARVPLDGELGDVLWVFIFCNGLSFSDSAVPEVSVHAISVFSRISEGMRHRYYERTETGFREVRELDVPVRAMLDLDDIRLLHFAPFDLHALPPVSRIYEFKADYWGVEDLLQRSDPRLRRAVLIDGQRLAGAPAIGLNGDEVYAALLRRPQDDEESNCGNNTSCTTGTGTCEAVPPSDSAGYICKSDAYGDPFVSVFTKAIHAGLVSAEAVDFASARRVVTSFLPRSPLGRSIMGLYYVASRAVRRDRTALEEYIHDLPVISRFLHEVLHGPNDAVVITDQLRAACLRILDLHKNVREPIRSWVGDTFAGIDWSSVITKADLLGVLGLTTTEVPPERSGSF